MALIKPQAEELFNVYLLPEHRTTKPAKDEAGRISTCLPRFPATLTLDELAHRVGELGETVCPCTLTKSRRNQSNFKSSNLVMIDIDNGKKVNGVKQRVSDDRYLSIDKVMNDELTKKYSAFIYESFNSSKNWNRFRIVFALDDMITDLNKLKSIYNRLIKHYGSDVCDADVNESTRFFYGGNKIHVIDLANRLSLTVGGPNNQYCSLLGPQTVNHEAHNIPSYQGKQDILTNPNSCQIVSSNIDSEQVPDKNLTSLIKDHDWESVKDRWSDLGLSPQMSEAEFVKSILDMDMTELFELPMKNPFIDILHQENNPSGEVFIDQKDGGLTKYHCFSRSNPYTGNNIELFSKLARLSLSDSIYRMAYLVKVKFNDGFKLRVNNMEKILRTMSGKRFKADYPNAAHYFNTSRIMDIQWIFKYIRKHGKQVFFDGDQEVHLFFMSSRTMAKQMLGDSHRHRRISKVLTLMACVGMIYQANDRHIPDYLLDKMYLKKFDHHVNCYKLGNTNMDKIESMCAIMKTHHVMYSSISKETLIHLFGLVKASTVFRQKVDMARTISVGTRRFIGNAESIINEMIDEYGFAVDKIVIDMLSEALGISKGKAKYKMNTIHPYLINHGYRQVRLTKKLKSKLGVTNYFKAQSSPVIYLKQEDD